MKSRFNLTRYDLVAAVLSVALFAYSVYRAKTLGITIDEASTFVTYVKPMGYGEIATQFPSAANHLLNSLAMKASSQIFGTLEFALRLPSLLAHALFLLTSILMLRRLSPALYLGGFAILHLNPYLLDFFSVARGYAMAATATLASLGLFLALVRSGRAANLTFGFIIAALGVLANFALLHYYAALLIAFNVYLVSTRRAAANEAQNGWFAWMVRHNVASTIVTIVLAAIIYGPIQQLRAGNQLYFGGTKGFWENTVGSLLYGILYDSMLHTSTWPLHTTMVVAIAVIVVLLVAAVIVLFVRGRQGAWRDPRLYALLCLVLPGVSEVLQFHVFGTRFLILRTALFFVPLFVVNLWLAFEALVARARPVGLAVLFLLAALLAFHSARKMNTWRIFEWTFCPNLREVAESLERQKHFEKQVFCTSRLFLGCFKYYREGGGHPWLLPIPLSPKAAADRRVEHYFVLESDLPKFGPAFEVVERYDRWVTLAPGSAVWLRRKSRPQ